VVLAEVLPLCAGPTEQQAKNRGANPHRSMLTGNGTRPEGLDLVVEGKAGKGSDLS
jgi:hypothetical protein